jgi:excisionase family DNA binding protein
MLSVLTLEEVADYLRVHPSTIYRLAKKNQIPAFKIGSDWRFNRESIDVWRLQAEQDPNSSIPVASTDTPEETGRNPGKLSNNAA